MNFASMKRLSGILGFTSIVLSSQVQAIALGQIDLESTQLQPLRLTVDLVETEGVLIESMAARISGPAQFLAANLVYQSWYPGLMVSVVEKPLQTNDQQGRNFALLVVSKQPVAQDTLDLIFEVDYLGGRLLAEYAVSLPAFTAPAKVEEPVEEPVEETLQSAQTQALEAKNVLAETLQTLVQNDPASTNSTPSVTAPEPVEQAIAIEELPAPISIVVKPGQTLWSIAAHNSPSGVNPWQTLMVLYSLNPEAFRNGDIRHLLSGSSVKMASPAQVEALSVKQAKARYAVLSSSFAEVEVKTEIKAEVKAEVKVKGISEKDKQEQQALQDKLAAQQKQVAGLTAQSDQLQQAVISLQTQNDSAAKEKDRLAQTNKNLAQGVASQKKDMVELSEQRTELQSNMAMLDQKFETTQADLNKAQHDLTQAQLELENAQASASQAEAEAQTRADEEQNTQWLSMFKMLAMFLVPIVLVVGLIWWIIGRGRQQKVMPAMRASTPELVEPDSLMLDPLTDYDTKPSAKAADLHDSAKQMQGMPERSFIEQLLQEQELNERHNQTVDYGIEDDQVHLSSEIEAMLNGQRDLHGTSHEPEQYQSQEADLNTKLDLAQSFIHMGQIEQARSLLQAVLSHGNDAQQTQAAALMSRLPKR